MLWWAAIGYPAVMTIYGYLRTSKQQQEGAAGMDRRHRPARSRPPASPRPTSTATSAYRVRPPARPAQDGAPSRTGFARATRWSSRSWPASGADGQRRSTIRQLRGEGVRFRSLAEGESTWARYLEADEDSPDRFVGELLLQVAPWAAAQELEAIRCRTKVGLDRARAEGKTLGRPWAGPDALRQLAAQQRLGGASYGETAKDLNVGRSTVRSWLRRAGVP